jgi:hypothetical protein
MRTFRHFTEFFLNASGISKKGDFTDEPRQAREMNDAPLEMPQQPEPAPTTAEGEPAGASLNVSACVQRSVLAWAMDELASLRLSPLDPQQAAAGFAALNATSNNIYVYAMANGSVELLEKPSGFAEIANNKRRALVYLAFFRSVCIFLPAGPPFLFAFAAGDKVAQRVDLPVFAFQKRRGERTILLPDIDFLNHDFYEAARYDDVRDYQSKLPKAIFVGSTSGGRVTPEAARKCSLPRLRAAQYFDGNPRVDFLLPQIVQTSSEEAAEILRQRAFCQTSYMAWPEQLLCRFVISMDGNGATCSRVVIALKSNSVLLKYASDDLLYYFRQMQPWLHYVPVEKDSDIDGILDMEQASPAFFESIAEQGRQFAATYLSRDAVVAYTVEVFKIYAQCFSNGAAQEIAVSKYPFSLRNGQKLPVSTALVAHMQGRGDVMANEEGWVGDAENTRLIEGFTFSFGIASLNRQFSYRSLDADGAVQAETDAGKYCGTRGKAAPIHGFVISCVEETSDVPALVYEGIFNDGFFSGPVMQGVPCRSPLGAPMVAMRIGVAMDEEKSGVAET